MTCRDVVATLDDYIANRLPTARRRRVDVHLSECDQCSAYLRSYVASIAAAKSAFSEDRTAERHELLENLARSILRGKLAISSADNPTNTSVRSDWLLEQSGFELWVPDPARSRGNSAECEAGLK
jgi:hypothetical protein